MTAEYYSPSRGSILMRFRSLELSQFILFVYHLLRNDDFVTNNKLISSFQYVSAKYKQRMASRISQRVAMAITGIRVHTMSSEKLFL